MKSLTISRLVPVLAASLLLAAPVTGLAKDKHRHHHRHHHAHHSHGRSVYVSGFGGHYSPFGYSSYGRSYYGGYGSSYCAPRYYTPRASIGFSLFTSPSYYYPSYYRSSRYYPSSYSYSRSGSRASYSDDLAVDVQRALRRNGYYYGDIDGAIGPESRAAIRNYQRDRGLPATGRIDSSLLRSLRIG